MEFGCEDEQAVTTLEKRMECGVGIRGRRNVGTMHASLAGSMFTSALFKTLPNEN